MMPKKIKLYWIAWTVVTLLASAAVSLSILWPRLFPSLYTTDLYRRYEHNDYIRATEIHNFHVNDTLSVDALLLEATTDSAWCALMVDFGTSEEYMQFYMSNKESFVGENVKSVSFFFIDINNPAKRENKNNPNSRLVVKSHEKKTICVFMTDDDNIKSIISSSEIKKLKK